ncbi:hypothetical protein SteCoe_11836 [Stentor coeruleus]|uniref:Uncharacterized protein n=1 Tax=Stentor coeruleus TaxID=5963 RepID=A0A1R2CC92_9CILI|nr:hypothetical protein SteCoe_11836 [Stentor coeruleus]
MFSIECANAVRVFSSLNSSDPKWSYLNTYYKIKGLISIVWILEISLALVIFWVYNYNVYPYLVTVIMGYCWSIVNMFFVYSLYSCKVLGEQGRFNNRVLPSIQNLGTHENDQIYIAQEFKQITAYPLPKFLPKCEYGPVIDFTTKTNDNTNKPSSS